MSEKTIDIVDLIENNPLIGCSRSDYSSDIICRIREKFTTYDQRMFIANFYCYLNYDERKDFVVELNNVWKWLGYSRIDSCKMVLVKNFTENVDYKIKELAPDISGAGIRSGRIKESVKMTLRCFKKLCFKSKTAKANKICDYYIDLQDILFEAISEQCEKLKNQLLLNDSKLEEKIEKN
jgi:hypothetical protein